jgi:outer membrane receptor protein involved in Fe transport
MRKLLTIFLVLFSGAFTFAQTTVSGTVTDVNTNDPIPGANIRVIGNIGGASTDFDGKFSLNTSEELPFSIEISFVGYTSKTVRIDSGIENLTIKLVESDNTLDEIVVSASRTPESLRESPVTIERMDVRAIKNSTSASFYTGLNNLKGVDVKTNSLSFNSVNTKGFSTFSNTRFVQLIDGMDNSSPALNFVMGNLIGANELDLKSVEIIPGASSALYGANAFNGILFMTTKNPFDYQGISFYAKTGLTIQDSGDNNYIDFGIRAAHAFSDKFAAKVSFSYMKGTDWMADDTNEYVSQGAGLPDKINPYETRSYDHDAINIYGDEIATNIHEVAKSMEAAGLIPGGASALVPNDNVGRTGYLEKDLTDYNAESAKVDVSLNYRPMGDDLEISYNFRSGFGSTIYQGTNRYNIKDFTMTQNKLEIKNNNFFLRGYSTSEDAGKSYDMVFTGVNMNRDNSPTWFGTYVGAYLQATMAGATSDQAHQGARAYADNTVTLQPGTPEFDKKFNEVISDPDFSSGSKFVDKTKVYVGEGNYNFSSLFDHKFNLQAGGSFRQYSLNSAGTIFTDYDGSIDYNEYGAYLMASKKLMEERLILSASIRYDKNEFFDGSFSPRASIVYSAGDHKQHNFRASFQTGFRNPTTQDLFIGLDAGRAILVGSSPDNLDRDLPNTDLTGRKAYNDSYSLSSVLNFAATGDPSKLEAVVTDLVTPEKVKAFDIGYRGSIEGFSIDVTGYYNIYDDFISQVAVITPINGSAQDGSGVIDIVTGQTQVFSLYTNSPTQITSYGASIGVNKRVFEKLDLGFSYTWTSFEYDQQKYADFEAGFNTPEHQFKASIGSINLFEGFGFNVNYRFANDFLWESNIANAVVPSTSIFDAQINYSVPKIKSLFKIGGTNIGGDPYMVAPGTGYVGSMYYISWVINQ